MILREIFDVFLLTLYPAYIIGITYKIILKNAIKRKIRIKKLKYLDLFDLND